MEALDQLTDHSRSDVRIDSALAAAEYEQRAMNSHHAATVAAVHTVLEEARYSPEVFVGGHASRSNRDHVEFAERAAIADLAVRLAVSENTIRAHEQQAVVMIARTPLTWERFRWGEVSPANARTVAESAASLPDDDASAHSAFDAAIVEHAVRLAPARLKPVARKLRERLVAETAEDRHRSALESRRVVTEHALDGMGWLSAFLPAEVMTAALARLDAEALILSAEPAETRTMDQLRADILSDWLTGATSAAPVGVRLGVMVPMLTLLGLSEAPATLEGYGPIDAATARRLAGDATSIYRLLTDPVSGAVLDIDQPTKYIPKGLRRMRQVIDQTCTFPGCGRAAVRCDLDHTVDRQFGGRTTVMNLSHLCRKHHRVKHNTRWTIAQDESRRITWTSPTGRVVDPDPPPF